MNRRLKRTAFIWKSNHL